MTIGMTPAYTVAGVAVTEDQANDLRMCVGGEYQWLMNKFLTGQEITPEENNFLYKEFVNRNIQNSASENEPYRKRMLAVRALFYEIHRNIK